MIHEQKQKQEKKQTKKIVYANWTRTRGVKELQIRLGFHVNWSRMGSSTMKGKEKTFGERYVQ